MGRFCPSCGTEAKEGDKFCLSCGASLDVSGGQGQVAQVPPAPAAAPVPPPAVPPPVQPQYAPMPSKKPNMKLIGILIGVIIAVVVIVVVLFFILGGSNDFVGRWTVDSMSMNGQDMGDLGAWIEFKSDGTYSSGSSTGSTETGTWEVRNSKLYIDSGGSTSSYSDEGVDYSFSNGGNTLTLTYTYTDSGTSSSMRIVMSKSSSSSSDSSDDSSDTSSDIDPDLVGTWTSVSVVYTGESTDFTDATLDFNSDGTYELDYYDNTETGTWGVSNSKLVAQADDGYSYLFYYSDMDYSLSDGGNTLTFGYSYTYEETYSVDYIFEKT